MKLITRPGCAAAALLSFVLVVLVGAQSARAAAPTIIKFPDRPIGRFNIIRPAPDPGNDVIVSKDSWAKGTISVPPGCVLSLTLNFNGSQNTKFIRQLPSAIIRNLTCKDKEIDDKAVADLCTQKQLRALNLQGTDLTDDGIKQLSHLKEMHRLNICDTLVTARGLDVLHNMPHLANLNLSRILVGDSVAEKLQPLKELYFLELTGTQLKDKAVIKLPRFDRLRELSLRRNNVSDRCIESLLKYKNLQSLNLTDTWITAAGLKRLSGLPKLREVYYRVKSLKPAERVELKRLLKNVKLRDGSHEKEVPLEMFAPLH